MMALSTGFIDPHFFQEDKGEDTKLTMYELQQKKKQELIDKIIIALQWFFGWLPRNMNKKIEELENVLDLIIRVNEDENNMDDADLL